MGHLGEPLASLWPSVAFLLFGVPLAALLGRFGYFEAIVAEVGRRRPNGVPVAALWLLAGCTTVVMNLDTTVVLLTPVYIRMARRSGVEVLPIAVIPLMLAGLSSSVLPVSNLTTLIVAGRLNLGVGAVFSHLALPSIVAATVGWLVYRRTYPTRLSSGGSSDPNFAVLRTGSLVVAGALVGFVVGPAVGVDPWMTAAAADVVLMVLVRMVPWRSLPLRTAAFVSVLAVVVDAVAPTGSLSWLGSANGPVGVVGSALGGAVTANVVNNLPATLLALEIVPHMSWGMWGWLFGVNAGAVLLPLGALANLLWLRIVRSEGIAVGIGQYVRVTWRVALPAFASGCVVLGLERLVVG